MDHEDAQLAAVRALNAEARSRLKNHPSSDKILEYHEQALSADAAERLRDHLAICPDCAQRALDLAALLRPDHFLAEEDLPKETAAAEWQALKEVLDQRDSQVAGTAAETVVKFPKANRTIFGSLRFAYATAALFFLTSLGLSILLGTNLQRAPGPQAGPVLVDLQPAEVIRRDGIIVPAAPIDARADNLLILSVSSVDAAKLGLGPDGLPSRVGYWAKIIDLRHPKRPVVRKIEGLELIEGTCTVLLPAHSLGPGSYAIQLFALGSARLAEYELDVEGPARRM